jgi:hypothetical protein
MIEEQPVYKVFLLSPAFAGGKRARMLLREDADFELAVTLRTRGAPLGEVYSFLSGLYFRGKIEYTRKFASPPAGVEGTMVITPGSGLLSPETRITLDELREIASVPVDPCEPRFREPLERDARALDAVAGELCRIVLLGSIASVKYFELLLAVFNQRFVFPVEFAGRGDMSRGGLMLRCARNGMEMTYVEAATGTRHGARPPRLE